MITNSLTLGDISSTLSVPDFACHPPDIIIIISIITVIIIVN